MTLETLELLHSSLDQDTPPRAIPSQKPKRSRPYLSVMIPRIKDALGRWRRRRQGIAAPDSKAIDRIASSSFDDILTQSGGRPLIPCRQCGKSATRRVCATCATEGFIELQCGCIERPDGTRSSCDVSVHVSDPRPMGSGHCYSAAVYASFGAWADAASKSPDVHRAVHRPNSTEWRERAWSLR